MTINVIRRKMRNNMEKASANRSSLSLTRFSFFLLILSIVSFCTVHLVVSSVLDPRGKELRMLNSQKDQLVEENRVLQQEIAKMSSLSVVTGRAEKELGMEKADDVIYINTPSVSANMETTSN